MRDRCEDALAQNLGRSALGHVLHRPDHAHHAIVVVDDHAAASDDPALAPVVAHDPVRQLERRPLLDRALDAGPHELAVLRVHTLEERLVCQPARRRHAVDVEELLRPADSIRGHLPLPTADVRQLLGLGEARRGALQLE